MDNLPTDSEEYTAPPSTEKPNSPFLDISSFAAAEPEIQSEQEEPSSGYEPETPFQALYKFEETEHAVDPEAEEFIEFLADLHDDKFEEAILEVASEAANFYAIRSEDEFGDLGTHSIVQEHMLEEYVAPLAGEMEALLEVLAKEFESRGDEDPTEAEVEALIDQFVPRAKFSPSHENLFGGWKKKLKKWAKKAGHLAKKGIKAAARLGLGPVLRKLKRYIRPLLKQVLQRAIKKLPRYLQPVARRLSKRYFGRYVRELEDEETLETDEDAIADVSELQIEFDQQIAQFLFASDEAEQETMLAEAMVESEQWTDSPLSDLDRARARFVSEIGELEDDQDPTPALERFIPAILPILKVGLKLAGRKRVVNYLAKYLARLIRKFVGRRYARPLSRAVVDLGLKNFGLEVTEEDARGAGGEAVAYAVEETVRKIANLPEYVLESEQLLESEILRKFEDAAAAYLPAVLSDATYDERPELRETSGTQGFWAGLPLRNKKKRYRKFTGRFPALTLNPHSTRMIKTWRGRPLSAHLRNRLGLPLGRRLKAQLHLFEVMPGTSLQDISRLEKNILGLGTTPAWTQLHPYTKEAAGLLTGEPALGRDFSERYLDDPMKSPAVGQRFYYLEIAEARPQVVTSASGMSALRRPSEVNIVMDFARDLLRVSIFLSEVKAQELAAKLRQHAPVGMTVTTIKSVVEPGLRAALSGRMHHRVRVIHPAVAPEQSHGKALKWLPNAILEKLEEKLIEWVGRSVGEHFLQRTQDFVTATEAHADGVTLTVTFSNSPGFPKIRRVLGGEPVVLRGKWFPDGVPDAKIEFTPGN